MRGRIARIVADKGFGFIRGDDGQERFFHRSAVRSTDKTFEHLREGMAVEFTPDSGPKGPRAEEIRLQSQ